MFPSPAAKRIVRSASPRTLRNWTVCLLGGRGILDNLQLNSINLRTTASLPVLPIKPLIAVIDTKPISDTITGSFERRLEVVTIQLSGRNPR
jgi:hypothetical protein